MSADKPTPPEPREPEAREAARKFIEANRPEPLKCVNCGQPMPMTLCTSMAMQGCPNSVGGHRYMITVGAVGGFEDKEAERLAEFALAYSAELRAAHTAQVNKWDESFRSVENSAKVFKERAENAERSLLQAREAKDGAYAERDNLVAALSKLFPSALERHPDSDTTWENDWRWIVFIDLPTGQATWHIHDSELAMFDHLPRFTGRTWDGHTTPQKYLRLTFLASTTASEGEASK